MTFHTVTSEGWMDGLVVAVSVNDQPLEVSLNEGGGVEDDDEGDEGDDGEDGEDGGGGGGAAGGPPAGVADDTLSPLPVIGNDSVEQVLADVPPGAVDGLLAGVLHDMGVGQAEGQADGQADGQAEGQADGQDSDSDVFVAPSQPVVRT